MARIAYETFVRGRHGRLDELSVKLHGEYTLRACLETNQASEHPLFITACLPDEEIFLPFNARILDATGRVASIRLDMEHGRCARIIQRVDGDSEGTPWQQQEPGYLAPIRFWPEYSNEQLQILRLRRITEYPVHELDHYEPVSF